MQCLHSIKHSILMCTIARDAMESTKETQIHSHTQHWEREFTHFECFDTSILTHCVSMHFFAQTKQTNRIKCIGDWSVQQIDFSVKTVVKRLLYSYWTFAGGGGGGRIENWPKLERLECIFLFYHFRFGHRPEKSATELFCASFIEYRVEFNLWSRNILQKWVFPIQRHIHTARVSFFFSFPPCLKLHNIAPTLNELSLFGMMVLSFIPPKHPIIPFVFLPICVCHWRRRKKTSQRCGIYCVCVWCMQAQGERQSHGLNYKELHMQFWWNGAHHQYIHNRTLAHTRKEWARQRIHQYCDISIASTPHQSKLK